MNSKRIAKGPKPFINLLEEINDLWVREDRDFGVPSPTDLAVTGQPYVELSGLTDGPSVKEAGLLGLSLFCAYAEKRPGYLYWHTEPTIERVPLDTGGYVYRVKMALLVSDNPVVPRLAAEAARDWNVS